MAVSASFWSDRRHCGRVRLRSSSLRSDTKDQAVHRFALARAGRVRKAWRPMNRRAVSTMHLVQVLLPLYDNDGHPFEEALHLRVKTAFTEKFGGVTAYVRSPAEGAWHGPSGVKSHDEIVIFEVMTARLDRAWWRKMRRDLARTFKQEQLVIRTHPIEIL